jgi:hypothetical protein
VVCLELPSRASQALGKARAPALRLSDQTVVKEVRMTVEARLQSLRARHAQLEDELHREQTRPHGDDAHVAELKREKLRLKDEIERLEHQVDA